MQIYGFTLANMYMYVCMYTLTHVHSLLSNCKRCESLQWLRGVRWWSLPSEVYTIPVVNIPYTCSTFQYLPVTVRPVTTQLCLPDYRYLTCETHAKQNSRPQTDSCCTSISHYFNRTTNLLQLKAWPSLLLWFHIWEWQD